MYQYDIRLNLLQGGFDTVENIGRNVKQCLLVLHNRQVIVRNDMEGLQHLIQHLTMLTCNTNDCLYIPPCLQLVDQRTHFYCFRSSAENQHDFFHEYSTSVCGVICKCLFMGFACLCTLLFKNSAKNAIGKIPEILKFFFLVKA